MKLCIVRPDNTIAEILMNERQPSIENINNELLFFENYYYKIIVRDYKGFENTELYIGDYSVPLHYNMSTDCYESEKDIVFNGCFDLASISIYVTDVYGEEKAFFTDFLRIASTKQTIRKVEQMLEEIEKNLPNFLDVCFSKNKKRSGLVKNDVRSIWNTLKIVDEIINIYEENYGYFCNHKKASVENIATVVDVHSMRHIDQESLRWIVCNPDNLVLSEKEMGIEVDGKQYLPSKVKTYISEYSYEVYENCAILGFLRTIIDYLEMQIAGFNKEIIDLQKIPESIIIQLPNTHELTGRCVYVYYKGVVDKFVHRKDLLLELFYKYQKMLGCVPMEISGLPKLTNTFKQIYHYRVCYECMIKWFETGDYTFNHLNYLFKLKTLSRIFEYFCLIKIQKAILQCGYILEKSNKIIYDEEDDQEEINNEYSYTGNGYSLSLLYEPTIWTNKLNEGINLYSTGYNFLKGKWNNKWTPDFVLKVSTNGRDYYYILDAKYSNVLNVKKRYISELVLKYSAQIASKDQFFSDIIGVGAVYPSDEDRIYSFKKNDIASSKSSFPKIFSLSVMNGEAGDAAFKEHMKELLHNIDFLEYGEETMDCSSSILNNGNGYREDESQYIRVDDAKSNNSNHHQEHVTTVLGGKKCYYYGKSLCLRKKVLCDAGKRLCDNYVSKNSKELKKEENSCRNFIHHVKRGKTIRVECLVTGQPGCIGSEECKFYMKKNKDK